jgi:prepilin-type N-terminal cleavage/methylation domain-containing protein
MKTKLKIGRGFTLVELLVVIVIIAALAGLTAPMVIRQRKKADQTEAVNNVRQIGIALMDFDNEYGSYPDAVDTAQRVADITGTAPITGTDSNDYFRQLIRAGISESEAMFYAKTKFTKKPDGIYSSDSDALKAGEVGFGIITMGQKGMNTAGNSGRPVAAAPFTTDLDGKFDYDVYDGKAVVLRVDNSVVSLQLNKTTGKFTMAGSELFATGEDTVWGETSDVPKWAYPTKK